MGRQDHDTQDGLAHRYPIWDVRSEAVRCQGRRTVLVGARFRASVGTINQQRFCSSTIQVRR
jgi:hypothetical protein